MKSKTIIFILFTILFLSSCTSFIPRTKLDGYNGKIERNLTVQIYALNLIHSSDNAENMRWITAFKEELEKKFQELNIKTDIQDIQLSSVYSDSNAEDIKTSNENNLVLVIRQENNVDHFKDRAFVMMTTLVDTKNKKNVWRARINSMSNKKNTKYTKSTVEYLIKVLKKDNLL